MIEIGSDQPSGFNAQEGLKLAIKALLVSPYFIYRTEFGFEGQNTELDPFEFRPVLVFYFMEIQSQTKNYLTLAFSNSLSDPTILQNQVSRMLIDEKSQSFFIGFVSDWLELYKLDQAKSMVPDNQQDLIEDMKIDVEEMIIEQLWKKGNQARLSDLFDYDQAYVSGKLADEIYNQSLSGTQTDFINTNPSRRGVLTSPAFLTAHGDLLGSRVS